MRKSLILVGAVIGLAAWAPADEGQRYHAAFRGDNTNYAAVNFFKNTIEDALRLSANVAPGGKKDPKACAECVIKMVNNFSKLVTAVFEDQRIEDAVAQEERSSRRKRTDALWQTTFDEFNVAFAQYMHSERGQEQLEGVLEGWQ